MLKLTQKSIQMVPEEKEKKGFRLFLGGLSTNVEEDFLLRYFSQFGVISKVEVRRDEITLKSKGFAFIYCNDDVTLEKIIGKRHRIMGRLLDCQLSHAQQEERRLLDKKRVFVGGLAERTTEAMIKKYFSDFGKVRSSYIIKNLETGKSKGFGFVEFYEQESAEKAMNTPCHYIGKNRVDVELFLTRKEQQGQPGRAQDDKSHDQSGGSPTISAQLLKCMPVQQAPQAFFDHKSQQQLIAQRSQLMGLNQGGLFAGAQFMHPQMAQYSQLGQMPQNTLFQGGSQGMFSQAQSFQPTLLNNSQMVLGQTQQNQSYSTTTFSKSNLGKPCLTKQLSENLGNSAYQNELKLNKTPSTHARSQLSSSDNIDVQGTPQSNVDQKENRTTLKQRLQNNKIKPFYPTGNSPPLAQKSALQGVQAVKFCPEEFQLKDQSDFRSEDSKKNLLSADNLNQRAYNFSLYIDEGLNEKHSSLQASAGKEPCHYDDILRKQVFSLLDD